jgi:hypothetical protein
MFKYLDNCKNWCNIANALRNCPRLLGREVSAIVDKCSRNIEKTNDYEIIIVSLFNLMTLFFITIEILSKKITKIEYKCLKI